MGSPGISGPCEAEWGGAGRGYRQQGPSLEVASAASTSASSLAGDLTALRIGSFLQRGHLSPQGWGYCDCWEVLCERPSSSFWPGQRPGHPREVSRVPGMASVQKSLPPSHY